MHRSLKHGVKQQRATRRHSISQTLKPQRRVWKYLLPKEEKKIGMRMALKQEWYLTGNKGTKCEIHSGASFHSRMSSLSICAAVTLLKVLNIVYCLTFGISETLRCKFRPRKSQTAARWDMSVQWSAYGWPWVAHLGLGHVQQTHRVTVTVEESSDSVQGFVELPLYVSQLLKHLAGRPQQHLDDKTKEVVNKICSDLSLTGHMTATLGSSVSRSDSPVPSWSHSCAGSSGEKLSAAGWQSSDTYLGSGKKRYTCSDQSITITELCVSELQVMEHTQPWWSAGV